MNIVAKLTFIEDFVIYREEAPIYKKGQKIECEFQMDEFLDFLGGKKLIGCPVENGILAKIGVEWFSDVELLSHKKRMRLSIPPLGLGLN